MKKSEFAKREKIQRTIFAKLGLIEASTTTSCGITDFAKIITAATIFSTLWKQHKTALFIENRIRQELKSRGNNV